MQAYRSLFTAVFALSGTACFAQCTLSLDYTPKKPVVGDTIKATLTARLDPTSPPPSPTTLTSAYGSISYQDVYYSVNSGYFDLDFLPQPSTSNFTFPALYEGPFTITAGAIPYGSAGYTNICSILGVRGASVTGQISPVPPPSQTNLLTGQYQFVFNGAVANGTPANQIATLGSFTLDGQGNITGGILDVNGSAGSFPALPVKGTYTLAGGQGTLKLTTPLGDQSFALTAAPSFSNPTGPISQVDLVPTTKGLTGLGSLRPSGSGSAYNLYQAYAVRITAAPPLTTGYPSLFDPAFLIGTLNFTGNGGGPVQGTLMVSSTQTGYLSAVTEQGTDSALDSTTGRFTFNLSLGFPLAQPSHFVGYLDGYTDIRILSLDSAKTAYLLTGTGSR